MDGLCDSGRYQIGLLKGGDELCFTVVGARNGCNMVRDRALASVSLEPIIYTSASCFFQVGFY